MTAASDRPSQILRIALAAARRLDAEGCLGAAARGALEVAGGSFALAYLIDATGEDLHVLAAEGGEGLGLLRRELEILDAGLVIHLAQGAPAVLETAEILLPTGRADDVPQLGAGLLVPLRSSAGLAGLLLLLARPDDSFVDDAPALAADLVRELVPALDNVRAVASLRDLVIRDDTADCYNRRYLDHMLEDEVERARRFGGELSLIFLDMDNLKDVNTHHGHAAGSRVLYEASVRIGRSIRSIDRLFRYGGDEFVVLLPGTSLAGAREAAERVRRELSQRPFELPSGAAIRLTASAGIAAWPMHGPGGRRVVEAADGAMRAVKTEGKNAVGVAPLPGTPPTPAEPEAW